MARLSRMQRTMRSDGFLNVINGYKTSYDQSRYTKTARFLFITKEMAEDLFLENGTFRKICTAPADEAVRTKFHLQDGDVVLDIDKNIQSAVEDIQGELMLSKAITFDRIYGGAAIFPVVDDGLDIEDPFNIDRVRGIDQIKVYSPREVTPYIRYMDSRNPKYQQVEIYQITDFETGSSFMVHESRLSLLKGLIIPNDARRQRDGWGGMVLEQLFQDLNHYDEANNLAIMLLSRLSQGIMKINDLMGMLERPGGEDKIRSFLHVVDMTRHILNTVAIDHEDDYDMKNISISGVSDIIDKMQNALSAVSEIPVTILFGRSPGGQNATGDADFQAYHGLIQRIQRRSLKPVLSTIVPIVAKANGIVLPSEYTIEFEPLAIPSEKEQAETNKLKADAKAQVATAANTYVVMGALDPSEVRQKIADEGEYDVDLTLNPIKPTPEEIQQGQQNIGGGSDGTQNID